MQGKAKRTEVNSSQLESLKRKPAQIKRIPMTATRQAGLALITVILIVALMVTLLGFLVEQQHLLTRRISNQNVAEQGYQYALGVSNWAARVLFEDKNRGIDHLNEEWAKFGRPPELESDGEGFSLTTSSSADEEEEKLATINFGEGVNLNYKLTDLQSRYNLNNLSNPDKTLLQRRKAIFTNLLTSLDIGDFDTREKMFFNLVDWMDAKEDSWRGGLESPSYRAKETSMHAADQPLTTLGELIYVEGFDAKIIAAIKPYVTVLPSHAVKLNLNTVSETMLASLSQVPPVDTLSINQFLLPREEPEFPGFNQSAVSQAEAAIQAMSPVNGAAIPDMLQTNSNYYQLDVKVALGDYQFCMQTQFSRGGNSSALEVEQQANQVTPPSATPIDSQSSASAQVKVIKRHYNTLCNEEFY